MKKHFRNLFIALDRFFNVLLFGGRPDDTISLNAAKAEVFGKKWGCYFCKILHWIDHGHCRRVLNNEPTKTAAGLRLMAALFILVAVVFNLLHYLIF